jgi:hypothetical protein
VFVLEGKEDRHPVAIDLGKKINLYSERKKKGTGISA